MEKMQLGIELETHFFLLSVLLGGGMGVAYDFFRIFRAVVPHNKVMTFIEDIIYVLLFALTLLTFSTCLIGSIRYFILAGMIIGCVIERLTIGNGILLLVRKITAIIRKKFLAPIIDIINKFKSKIKGKFVRNTQISENEKKVEKMS